MNDRAQAGLTLDNNVRHAHLAAKSRQEDDKLDRVNIVSDNDEGCLLRFNEGNTVVQPVLDEEGLLGVLKTRT